MSFLDKIKVKVEEREPQTEMVDDDSKKKATGFLQLDVDIFQTPLDIIVVAPIPGVEVKDVDISIENENDVVTIQGKREIPIKDIQELEEEGGEDELEEEEIKYLRQELEWGPFYRQIILPQEINVSEVEAKFRKGILILKLPLLRLQTKGRKRIEVKT